MGPVGAAATKAKTCRISTETSLEIDLTQGGVGTLYPGYTDGLVGDDLAVEVSA